jgi:hypothetical protein
LFGWLIRSYLLDRLLRGLAGAPPSAYRRPPYPASPRAFGPRGTRPRRGRAGFAGPFPYYSTTTRRGSRVSVGGCCLPIPLGFLVGASAVTVKALRRHT